MLRKQKSKILPSDFVKKIIKIMVVSYEDEKQQKMKTTGTPQVRDVSRSGQISAHITDCIVENNRYFCYKN